MAPHVGGIKLGLEFFTAQGPRGVEAVAAIGLPIFLDLKLHDIPNTVAGAVRQVAQLGVAMLTLHAAGGRAMLEAASAAAPAGLALLGVTVLTSLDEADLAAIGVSEAPAAQALRLGRLALEAGLAGLVCSPMEIATLRDGLGTDAQARGAGHPAGGGRRRPEADHGAGRGAGAGGRRAGDRAADHPGRLARGGGGGDRRPAARGRVRWP